jgi:hypothetical protein
LSRSRSSQRPSIFASILTPRGAAEAVEIPALLELEDFLALSSDLDAHVLDFGTDVI